ncbi:12829_t:CDS:2, partial [Funneliformis geosporum]
NKHRSKVGEPGFPVAVVERGKRVIVICNIPESINGDFYAGKVNIGLKDPIFQPSSPLRHATELYDILLKEEL